jgi:hypothetical protein
MPAGDEGAPLLRVVDLLCAELRSRDGDIDPGDRWSAQSGPSEDRSPVLSAEDESLVAQIVTGLREVASAAGAEKGDKAPGVAVMAALDGVELVIRGELVMGSAERLPDLMPGFVFLVTQPIIEQDRALELSRRAAELIDELS